MDDRIQRGQRGEPGGSLELAGLIGEHYDAFTYDWRSRFGLSVDEVGGRRMAWGEAVRLARSLAGETTSHVAVALADWSHPWSRESMLLADLFDLQHKVAAGKRTPKAYPRPWDQKPKRYGTAGASKAQMRALLDAHRASAPQPSSAATVP